ncbi:hypothetical protein GDO86_000734 [Hymenochirus boettgeri]|uniref:G protein-regulated inducer of neurite outgrowth C-terminal domain-containing protein n=1 Tax=Hymenochirus boettgeri TaxID=247094 RepID=A0A8T2K9P8_9PIPI|nr:hypothetical protein GDO86_000734 [Hymenochirus boettgeri]
MGTVPDPQGSAENTLVTACVEKDFPEPDTLYVTNLQCKQEGPQKNGGGNPISETCLNDFKQEAHDSDRLKSSFRTCSELEPLFPPEQQAIKDSALPISPKNNSQLSPEMNILSVSEAHLPLSNENPAKEGNVTKDNTMVAQTTPDEINMHVHRDIESKTLVERNSDNSLAIKKENISLPSQKTETLNREVNNTSKTAQSESVPAPEGELTKDPSPKSEECPQSDAVKGGMNKVKDNGTTESQLPGRFKEMGTMTSYLENWATQDAEVQAVANVENKSVSTSPSILAAFLKANSPVLKERQEQVCIIYQGNPGASQIERANFALQAQLSQNQLAQKLRFQTPDALSSQPLQLHTKSPPDLSRPAFQHPELARTSQILYRNELEGTGLCFREMPQMQLGNASPILMNVKPVYQINIENSNQPKARSKEMYCEPPHFRASDINNKSRLHHLSGVENIQLHNTRIDSDQTEMLSIPGDDSTDRKPFHFKITDEQGSTQAIITTDIKKPKKDDKPTPVHVEVEVNTIGAAGGQVDEILEVLVRKDQDEDGFARRSSSFSLQSKPASDFNQNAGQLTPRLRKVKEEKKEPVLVAISTSEQPKSLGKKATPPSSNAEGKSQAKQTKSVKDVVWDEQGMTWEVYGASMDPEALGIAIQNHLQRQIREHEKMIRAQLKQNRKSICSDSSGKKHKRRQHRVFQSIVKNFRRPNCCARPPPTSVLE